MTDTFNRNLMISLAGHITIACLVFLRAVFVPSEPMELRQAIRVDVVGLPPKMKEAEMPAPAAPQEAATAPKELPAKVEPEPVKAEAPKMPAPNAKTVKKTEKKDTRKAQREALNALKRQAALDKIKEDINKPKSDKPAGVVAGNQIATGNSFTGLAKLEFESYFDDLKNKVQSQWTRPEWMADAPLKAQALIFIDERGYIVKKVIRRSSGNEIFDSTVMEAIEKSSPLPPPPQRLQGALSTGGIILNFPE